MPKLILYQWRTINGYRFDLYRSGAGFGSLNYQEFVRTQGHLVEAWEITKLI